MTMTKKQNEKLQFFYDDEAAQQVNNQITEAYMSGYVDESTGHVEVNNQLNNEQE